MKKIHNPFSTPENQCFACSRHNPIGLKMDFFLEGNRLISEWSPRPDLQGYINVLHGGIQTTLMDEIASWAVYVLAGTAGVTSSLEVRFIKPVYVHQGNVTLTACIEKTEGSLASIRTELINPSGKICTEGIIVYFLFPEHIARTKYFYPGKEAFLPD